MDFALLGKLAARRVSAPDLWLLALLVGALINAYGQILVPLLRGSEPVHALQTEWNHRPGLLLFSVVLGFLFPFCVGLYSGVATSYRARHVARRASFPDEKPDPVFRVDLTGQLLQAGDRTREQLGQDFSAQDILGEEAWREVLRSRAPDGTLGRNLEVSHAGIRYLVTVSTGQHGALNIYLTRLYPGSPLEAETDAAFL